MHALTVLYSRLMVQISKLVVGLQPLPHPLTYVGPGSALQLCEAMGQFGCRRVLIVTDKILVELGLIDGIKESLNAAGAEVFIFDGVQPDPAFEQVEAGLAMYQSENCDSVLAVGGGSSLDAGKAIAVQGVAPQDFKSMAGFFKVKSEGAPFYAIPTTAGTGSEATMASVISDHETKTKVIIADGKLMPKAAALDAELMKGMPPAITAATGMDALTHAIESALSVMGTDETRRLAYAAIKLIFDNLPKAYDEGTDIKAREAMAIASFWAGAAFTRSNVGYVHAIAHQFGGLYHTPHGLANAMILPHVLAFYQENAQDKMADLARQVGVAEPGSSDVEAAASLVIKVRQLNKHIGVPQQLDAFKSSDVSEVRQRALTEAHGLFGYPVPTYMSADQCDSLLKKLLPAN